MLHLFECPRSPIAPIPDTIPDDPVQTGKDLYHFQIRGMNKGLSLHSESLLLVVPRRNVEHQKASKLCEFRAVQRSLTSYQGSNSLCLLHGIGLAHMHDALSTRGCGLLVMNKQKGKGLACCR